MRFLGQFAMLLSMLLVPAAALAGETVELHVEHASIVLDSAGQKAMQLELTPWSRADFAAFSVAEPPARSPPFALGGRGRIARFHNELDYLRCVSRSRFLAIALFCSKRREAGA